MRALSLLLLLLHHHGGASAQSFSAGGAAGDKLAPPTASYLTTSNGAGTPHTTPSDRALPVVQGGPAYPHAGGAALHGQGYAYAAGAPHASSSSASSSEPFPANYAAPGAGVPMSVPSLGSLLEAFPSSGIGNHNHFLHTIYPHPNTAWYPHAPWHQHAVYPHPHTVYPHPHAAAAAAAAASSWHPHAIPSASLIPTVAHHTIHHHHVTQYTLHPLASTDPALLPPIPPPTAFLQADPIKKRAGPATALAYPVYPAYPAHSHYQVLEHPVLPAAHDPNHLVTVYPPVYHDPAKMPYVPKGAVSPIQVVEQHVVHHHAVPALHVMHHPLLPSVGAHYLPVLPGTRARFLQLRRDLPPSAEWIRPPSPKYRFGAGVPLTPVNGAAQHTVHALLPGVNMKEGETAMMYGSNSPKTYEDPRPPPGQPQHWSHQSSLANPMYQQTNPMGSEAAKAPDVPKYSAVKRRR
jgi:hypothetical protein